MHLITAGDNRMKEAWREGWAWTRGHMGCPDSCCLSSPGKGQRKNLFELKQADISDETDRLICYFQYLLGRSLSCWVPPSLARASDKVCRKGKLPLLIWRANVFVLNKEVPLIIAAICLFV